jgi:hypothetical protein
VTTSGTRLRGQATAQASFNDDITLDVAGRTGEVVDLVFRAALSGSSDASVVGSGGTFFASASGGLHVTVDGERLTISDSFDTNGNGFKFDSGPTTVQITLGQSFQIQTALGTSASIRDLSGTSSVVTVDLGSALAPFGASGGPTSFQLFDQGGASIPNFTLASGSGQFQFYVVPEPSTGMLLLAGLLALVCGKRRFSHQP